MKLVWFISVLISIKFSGETELSSSDVAADSPLWSPQVTVVETTFDSLTIKLRHNPDDKEPIDGYTIRYKPEFGDWEIIRIENQPQQYKLENLLCGTRYQVQVATYNSTGSGDPSDILNVKTRGDKPENPSADKFIEVGSNAVVLHFDAWSDGGCPMLYFVVEQKKKTNTEWIQVKNNVRPGRNFTLSDLEPAVRYDLRVTAHNNAGFNVAEYEFATLTVTGEQIQ